MAKVIYFRREHEHQCRCGVRWECEMGKWCNGEVEGEICLVCAMKSLEYENAEAH